MSSDPHLHEILDDLAEGRIDAVEAARRIAAVETAPEQAAEQPAAPAAASAQPDASQPWRAYAREDLGPREQPEASAHPEAPAGDPGEPAASERQRAGRHEPGPVWDATEATAAGAKGQGAQRVRVRSVGRRVRIVGDRTVASAAVSGPHVLRRTGNTLEVTSEGQANPLANLNLLRLPRSLDDFKNIGLGAEVVVRVNPALTVDAEVTGSGLVIEGVPTLGRIRVTAGGASLKGVRRVEDVLVQMGSAYVEGPISEGRSRVKCESGTLTVVLAEGANVTVRGQANMGRLTWPGDVGAVDEWVVGNGSGRLDVEIVMGMASVKDAADTAQEEAGQASGADAAACPACGQPAAGARFCPSCGTPQPAATCSGCARSLPAGARFCPECGTPA